nr:MAG: putative RNA-dependent RNA polymerase [Reoviridae sp.]
MNEFSIAENHVLDLLNKLNNNLNKTIKKLELQLISTINYEIKTFDKSHGVRESQVSSSKKNVIISKKIKDIEIGYKKKKQTKNKNDENSLELLNDSTKLKTKDTSKGNDRLKGSFKVKSSIDYYKNLQLNFKNLMNNFHLSKITSSINYVFNNLSMLFLKDRILDLRNAQQYLDDFSYYTKLCPDLIIPISMEIYKMYSQLYTNLGVDFIKSTEHWGFNKKFDPIKMADFNYNEKTGICNSPKYRYFVNDSAKSCQELMEKEKIIRENRRDKNGTTINKDKIESVEQQDLLAKKINFRMFLDFGNQSRFGNLWSQILSAYIFVDCEKFKDIISIFPTEFKDEKERFYGVIDVDDILRDRRYYYHLHSIGSIAGIISHFKILPFYVSDLNRIFLPLVMEDDFGLSLPWVLFSLLELSVQEKGCNLLGSDVLFAVRYRYENAIHSFGTSMLNQKSNFNDVIKLTIHKCARHVCYRYINEDCSGLNIDLLNSSFEFFLDDDEEKIKKKFDLLPMEYKLIVKKYENYFSSGDHFQNSSLLRYIIMLSTIVGNPGIFYKTSLALEAEASIGAQTHQILKLPTPKNYIRKDNSKIPLEYDWSKGDEIYGEIYQYFRHGLTQIKDKLKKVNLEEFFVSVLTNNSQGIKVSISDLGIDESEDIKIDVFNKLSNSRLAAFVLDHAAFTRWNLWIAKMEQDGLCTIRYQVDRRARIVEIVSNYEQIGYSPILFVFEALKSLPDWKGISVGKQKGGIIDMTSQLYGSGNANFISVFSDVKGMDASTQPPIYKLLSSIFCEFIINNPSVKYEKYFPAGTVKVPIENVLDNTIEEKYLPGLLMTLLHINAYKNDGKKFILKDGYFTNKVFISTFFFASGQYNTSAQHSIILNCLNKCVIQSMKQKLPFLVFEYQHNVFGDDQFGILKVNDVFEIRYEVGLKYLLLFSNKYLKQLGFVQEISYSSGYNDYLQLSSLFGAYVPKSARATIYTNERSEALRRDPIALIKMMRNVLASASQRFHSIENILSLLIGIWLVLRMSVIHYDSFKQSGDMDVRNFSKNKVIIIPFITIFMPPIIQMDNAIIINEEIVLKPRASSVLQGDGGWIWLINSVLSEQDKVELLALKLLKPADGVGWVTSGSGEWTKRPFSIFAKKKGVMIIFISLSWLSYSRHELINKNRQELVGGEISKLAVKVDSYRNMARINRSRQANDMLKFKYGLSVNKNLAYYEESRERLEQAVQTLDELANELPISDIRFASFIHYIYNFISSKIQDQIDKYSFIYNWDDQSLKLNPLKLEFSFRYPICPGYRQGTSWAALLQLVGVPFGTGSELAKLQQFSSIKKNDTRFDYEQAIKIMSKAAKLGDEALQLVKDVFSLSTSEQNDLDKLFRSNDYRYVNFDYSSQFQPAAYFGLSGSVINLPIQCFRVCNVNATRIFPLLQMITRDLYFEHGDRHEFKRLNYNISMYAYKYYIMPLRKRLGGTIVNTRIRLVDKGTSSS